MQLFDNWPYMRARMEMIGKDTWTFVETGLAVAVLPIRKNSAGQLEILLIQEERPSGSVLKMAGGYLRDENAKYEAKALEILLKEAGVTTSRLHMLYSEMIGFEVVKLPISVFVADNWEVLEKRAAQLVVLSFDEAIKKVLDGCVGDQCTADALMRLYIMLRHFPSHLPDFLKKEAR